MVTRKPVASPVVNTDTPPKSPSSAKPPYPTTPIHTTELDRSKTLHSIDSVYSPDLHSSPAFDLIDMNAARNKERRGSDISSHGTWDDSDEEREDEEERHTPEDAAAVPKPLQIRPSESNMQQQNHNGTEHEQDELPPALRPGPANGVPAQPRKSVEEQRYEEEASANPWVAPIAPQKTGEVSSNPYRQQQNEYAPEPNSQAVWSEQQHAPPLHAPPPIPVELPTVQTPAEEMSRISLGEGRTPEVKPYETAEILAVPQQAQPHLASVNGPPATPNSGEDLLGTNNPWRTTEESAPAAVSPPGPPPKVPSEPEYAPPSGPPPGWSAAQQEFAPPPGPPPKAAPVTNLIDHPVPTMESPPQQAYVPPPILTAQPSASRSTESVPETPGTRDKRQRSENYQIKHVRWLDASYALEPRFKNRTRTSPILTQNANGPCPLLALVNALVLSTPQNVDSALIETLRTRETVSLGLLLDAVFEELMSGRRGNDAEHLPDVGELYSFLLALHTGMNVNPRFITPVQAPRGSLDNPPPEKAPLHPIERAQTKAGCFEETKEMRLYSTFNIPLIHGWTAPKDTPAYLAFERTALTFDDWLVKQFEEQELETKLREGGLNEDEQQTLQDIQTIKSFLATWPTQLTEYGLETISASLKPGQIAILFRNDHFSTLYKEPKHGALMTLVTDQGYSSHDEIVWESLVDVNGAASEMFSGDFRVVSHDQDVGRLNVGNSGGGEEGWETVQNSRSRYRNHDQRNQNRQGPLRLANGTAGSGSETPPALPGPRPAVNTNNSTDPTARQDDLAVQPPDTHHRTTSEQEDHDLALALQLQEEEEDRERQATERRRREQELSERYLSTETSAEGPRPPIPPRRSGRGGNTNTAPQGGRPGVNRTADPDAPPTYEQSANDRPYRPAGSTAAGGLQQGNPLNAYDALRRQQSAYAANSSSTVNSIPGNGRRQSQPGNRIRRRSSGVPGSIAPPGTYGSGGLPVYDPNGARVSGAAGLRDTDERCNIM